MRACALLGLPLALLAAAAPGPSSAFDCISVAAALGLAGRTLGARRTRVTRWLPLGA